MGDPFRDAAPTEGLFVVCPGCGQPVEVEAGSELARCQSCNQSFAAKDAQTLVEHDAAQRLAKALAPVPEDPRGEKLKRIGLIGGVMAPPTLVAAGFWLGSAGIALAALAFGGLFAAMNYVVKPRPGDGGPG